jgi:hypothetical protein
MKSSRRGVPPARGRAAAGRGAAYGRGRRAPPPRPRLAGGRPAWEERS